MSNYSQVKENREDKAHQIKISTNYNGKWKV